MSEGVRAGVCVCVIAARAQVVLEPPNLADVDAWEGAFLSSTSRLVLPIDAVALTAAPAEGAALATVVARERALPACALVGRVRELVAALVGTSCTRIE